MGKITHKTVWLLVAAMLLGLFSPLTTYVARAEYDPPGEETDDRPTREETMGALSILAKGVQAMGQATSMPLGSGRFPHEVDLLPGESHFNLACEPCPRGFELNLVVDFIGTTPRIVIQPEGSGWWFSADTTEDDLWEQVSRDSTNDVWWGSDEVPEWLLVDVDGNPITGVTVLVPPDALGLAVVTDESQLPHADQIDPAQLDTPELPALSGLDALVARIELLLNKIEQLDARIAALEGKTPPPAVVPLPAADPGQVVAQGEDLSFELKAGKYYHLNAWWRGDTREYDYVVRPNDNVTVVMNGTIRVFSMEPTKATVGAGNFQLDLSKFPALKNHVLLIQYEALK